MSQYAVFREQKNQWTKDKIESMTKEQRQQLVRLVKHLSPEVFEIKKEETRKRWISIMAGIYLRMINNYGPENYQTENWRQKREKLENFDITQLLFYENNKAQTPFNERGMERAEVLDR